MDEKCREVIQKYKTTLSHRVSLEKIKSSLKRYKIFTKAMLDSFFLSDSENDFYDELCTRGSNAFLDFLKVLEEAEYYDLAETLRKELDNRKYPTSYQMDSDPLGYCLIIINQKFEYPLKYRDGCEADAESLKELFEDLLNFKVEIKWNKGAKEMENILQEFSKKPEFRDVDCCIVYILSHGNQHNNLDFIYGTDRGILYIKDIKTIFNNDNCELLIGKPKIFFFQACRGDLLDKRRIVSSSKSEVCDVINKNIKNQDSPDAAGIPTPEFNNDRAVEESYPILSDMFIVHSTLLYFKSWKDDYLGSWLCQDLVSVIPDYYDKHHLSEMMTIVSDKQRKRESSDGYKQITQVDQPGIRSLIYFNKAKKQTLKKS